MARPKKTKAKKEEIKDFIEVPLTPDNTETSTNVVPTPIAKLAIDYPSEGLNNMAIKINEIIDHLNDKE